MANKRNLKKFIHNLAEDLTCGVLPYAVYQNAISEERADEIIWEISASHARTMARLAVAFDKGIGEFSTPREFRHAKTAYFKLSCHQALNEFVAKIESILDEINKAQKK